MWKIPFSVIRRGPILVKVHLLQTCFRVGNQSMDRLQLASWSGANVKEAALCDPA